MLKRGQISLFIILGILILAVAGVFFLVSSYTKYEVNKEEFKTTSIEYYIGACVERTLEKGLIFLGQRGGYYDPPEKYDSDFLLPLYYENGNDFLPTLAVFQNEIEKYLDNMMPLCLQNFLPFLEQGYQVKSGQLSADADFNEQSINIIIKYPTLIAKGSSSKYIHNFTKNYAFSFHKLINFLGELIDYQKKNQNYVPFHYISFQDTYSINLFSDNYGFVIYELVDNNTLVDDMPYSFSFLFKYDWNITDVHIEPILDKKVKVGDELSFQVEAIAVSPVYNVSHLLEIDKDGLIHYKAVSDDVGNHTIRVRVVDEAGQNAITYFKLEVIP